MPSLYVTTNIRLPEEDYLRLKMEAAGRRVSLSEVIREKLVVGQVDSEYDILNFAGSLKTKKKPLSNEKLHELFAGSYSDKK